MSQSGAAKRTQQKTGRVLSGPALQVINLAAQPATLTAGAAMPIQVVNAAYVAIHGLQAGEPVPIYQVATGKVQAGAAVPVYVVG